MQKHSGTIIIAPRITEKGAYLDEQSCYVFNVSVRANKGEIARAVEDDICTPGAECGDQGCRQALRDAGTARRIGGTP